MNNKKPVRKKWLLDDWLFRRIMGGFYDMGLMEQNLGWALLILVLSLVIFNALGN